MYDVLFSELAINIQCSQLLSIIFGCYISENIERAQNCGFKKFNLVFS